MTYPITPVPSFHIDPMAAQEAEAELKQALASLQAMFASIAPQIIQLIVNAILKAFGLGAFAGDIDALLSKLQSIMSAIPAGNISGDISAIDQALRDAISNALGHAGSNFSLTSVISFLESIPGGNITGILTNALQNALNIFGQLRPLSMPILPVSHIRNINPNLLQDPTFTTTSGVMTANGTLQQLLSNPIPVTQGEVLDLSVNVAWTGLSSTSSPAPLQMIARPYNAGVAGTDSVIGSDASPGSSGSTAFSGSYTVPANVDTVYQVVLVDTTATAGTVTWSTASVTKAGTLAAGTGLVDAFENTLTHFFGSNTLGTNLLYSLLPNISIGGVGTDIEATIQTLTDDLHNAIQGTSTSGNTLATVKSDVTTIISNLFGSAVASTVKYAALPNISIGGSANDIQSTIQALTDGIHQAVQGGSGTGNPISDAKTQLLDVFDNLFGSGNAPTTSQVPNANITSMFSLSNVGADLSALANEATNALTGGSGSGNTPASLGSALKTISQANNIVVPPSPGTGSVSHDSTGSSDGVGNANSVSVEWTQNIASDVNYGIIAAAIYYTGSQGVTITASWGGVAMTQLAAGPNVDSIYVQIFGLAQPPTGTGITMEAACTVGGIIKIEGIVGVADGFIGVENVANLNFVEYVTQDTVPSITQAAGTGDIVYNVIMGVPATVAFGTYNQTATFNENVVGEFDFITGYAAGASSVTFDTGSDNVQYWLCFAMNLTPVPTNAIGSGFLATNTSTTATATSTGTNVLPASFYSEVAITSDLTYTASTNKITVTYAGWYAIEISILLSAAAGNFGPCLFHNSSATKVANVLLTTATGVGPYSQSFIMYLGAGDTIQAGYTSSSASASVVGESTGTKCYFSVALMNRSVY